LLQTIWLILQLLYWFHPLLLLARRRCNTLGEICCDQMVIAALAGNSRPYRRTLIALSGVLDTAASPLSFSMGGSELLARLEWLAVRRPDRPALRRTATALVFAAVLVTCVPLARPATLLPLRPLRPLQLSISPPEQVVPSTRQVSADALAQLPGCLQRRFIVLAALAESQKPDSARTLSATTE
jgi:hypothetical protein